ncbi:MAG: hypothetical protein ACM3KR_04655 [Deltaproteobacteria bacterium]
MKETYRLIKAILFVVITFIFAFIIFTGKYPSVSQKDKQDNLITNKAPDNEIKTPLTKNIKKNDNTGNKKEADLKSLLKGSWQAAEINSQGETAKIDLSKQVPPEEILIYNFESDRINVYWGNTKSILTYKWISKDTIETIQPAVGVNGKDYKERAVIRIQGDKLYMQTVNEENNKSSGSFVRFKGELPKVISKANK